MATVGTAPFEHRLALRGDGQALPTLFAAVDAFASAAALTGAQRNDLHLVLEELVTNAIAHGYGQGQHGWIHLSLHRSRAGVEMTLCDRAKAFDPLAPRPATAAASLEAASIGGVGLTLVRRLTSGGCYRRVAGRNMLRLRLRDAPG